MTEEQDKELSKIFQQVFSTENGKIVLESLERAILDASPYHFEADFQTDSLLREGGRQLVELINRRMNDNINN